MPEDFAHLKEQALKDFEKRRYHQALENFELCLQSCKTSGDELAIAEMRNNISVTHVKLKDGEKALEAVQDTDQVFLRHGDPKRQAMALANTATALELLGRKEEALEKYQVSLDIFKEIGEKEMRTYVLRRVSDLQLKTRRELQAVASMESAYEQGENTSIKNSVFRKILTTFRKRMVK